MNGTRLQVLVYLFCAAVFLYSGLVHTSRDQQLGHVSAATVLDFLTAGAFLVIGLASWAMRWRQAAKPGQGDGGTAGR
jgi:hypothetical protein